MQKTRREFVSQKDAEAANACLHQDFARLTAPPPLPDYEDIIKRMNAARNKRAPGTVRTETAVPTVAAAPR